MDSGVAVIYRDCGREQAPDKLSLALKEYLNVMIAHTRQRRSLVA